jgi:hypothetical protein
MSTGRSASYDMHLTACDRLGVCIQCEVRGAVVDSSTGPMHVHMHDVVGSIWVNLM